jgi:hypothetical protein
MPRQTRPGLALPILAMPTLALPNHAKPRQIILLWVSHPRELCRAIADI